MNKSVLVIDTPKSCLKCEFSAERLCGNGRCTLNKDSGNVIPDKGKPDWCPLKDVPEKRDAEEARHRPWTGEYKYLTSWNDCIDEILKGSAARERKAKIITNADWIRSLSNEELAKFLEQVKNEGYRDFSIFPFPKDFNNFSIDMLEWLESERKKK